MRDVGASTVARIQRRVQEDRDEDAAFRVVEDPGHDNSGQDCHNDQDPHIHDHRADPDFTLEKLPRNKEERQVKQSPQWTEHQARHAPKRCCKAGTAKPDQPPSSQICMATLMIRMFGRYTVKKSGQCWRNATSGAPPEKMLANASWIRGTPAITSRYQRT